MYFCIIFHHVYKNESGKAFVTNKIKYWDTDVFLEEMIGLQKFWQPQGVMGML